MAIKVIRIARKLVTGIAAVAGIGTGGTMAVGELLTGELIFDLVLLIGSLIIVGVNGKDGLPDWMNRMLEKKYSKNKRK